LQSWYTLQLGSICSPIPPLPLILVRIIINVFLLLLLLLFLLFSTLSWTAQRDFPHKSRDLLFSPESPRPFRFSSSDRDGYVRLKLRFPRSPGRARGVGPQATSTVHRFVYGLILVYIILFPFSLVSSPFILFNYLGPTFNYLPGVFGSHKAWHFFFVYFGLSLAEEIFGSHNKALPFFSLYISIFHWLKKSSSLVS
jgi:hypothetical protein